MERIKVFGNQNIEARKNKAIPLYSAEELKAQREMQMEELVKSINGLKNEQIGEVMEYVNHLRDSQANWN